MTHSITVSNNEFLNAVFGVDAPWAHLTSFLDDPSDIPNDRRHICWGGDYASRRALIPDSNQYYTISTFYADDQQKARRRKALFRCTHVIVADDVEEKLPLTSVNRLPPPSFKLETSPGSQQWGWILAQPATDRAQVENLLDGLVVKGLAPDGKDPGMKGVTRYVRLPEGVNTKASRITANRGLAPRCRMLEWHPERKVTLQDLAEPFEVDLFAARKEGAIDGAADIPDHPLLEVVHVKSVLSEGRYDITCPWVDEHTGQADDGAAVWTNADGSSGFKCHHGTCESKKLPHLLDHIESQRPGFKTEFSHWKTRRVFDGIEAPDGVAEEGRASIEWEAHNLNKVVASVKKQLIAQNNAETVLSYGGQLICVRKGQPQSVRQMMKSARQEADYPDQYRVFAYTLVTCQIRILDSVAFYSSGKPVKCPEAVAKALLDDSAFAPVLGGLLEAPTVTPQGRLLSEPGYDKETGHFCAFDARLATGINRTPSKEDAKKALDFITSTVFADFPFKTDVDRVAALAFLLTAFTRRFLGKAPGFMVTATTQGSGKSTLADIVFQAAFGRPAAAATYSKDQPEMAKLILAILMEGQSGICFDNIPFGCRVDGDELAKLLTQEVYQGRILGSSKTVSQAANVLVCLTGNQLAAVNDMRNRLLPIYLEPDVEDPENRKFMRRDIDAWHDEHRGKIVRAVCTILLGWQNSEAEIDLKSSRFTEWDDAVRKPLVWLGLPDPVEQFELNKEEDPKRSARGNLLQAWHQEFGEEWISLDTIANYRKDLLDSRDLAVALAELFPNNSPDARHIGFALRQIKDAIIDGLKLVQKERTSKSKKARPWRVVSVSHHDANDRKLSFL